ncbi:hypothetical protein ACT3S7_07325 [Corynebacterium sp. AOP34-AQ2-28]|uniref:hypothetical protein n=1 Tax=Corynebacterium sp. AOP34-AQ2-28 TaxID=3457689 RepID=UPI004034AFB8
MKTIRACSAALIPALIAGLALTSCSSDAADSASTSTDTRAASSEAFPLTVDHFRGTTEIEQAPQRIIALDNAFLDYAVDLGGTVVGVSDIGADLVPSYLDDEQAARAADVESVGDISEPQLEEIAPTVFSEDTGDTWQENYLLTGEALGKAEEARDRLDAIGERAGRIGERVRDAASDGDGDGVPDVSVVRIKDENTIRLYGEDTFSGSVLAMVDLPRPANQESGYPGQDYGMYVVSRENLDQAEADLLLVAVPEEGTAKAAEWAAISDAVLDTATWKAFAGRKVDVDEGTWMTSVSPIGADHILTDVADIFDVDGE